MKAGSYRQARKAEAGSDGKASVCNAGDSGSIPGLGRSLEKEMAAHSSILAWKIPWTAEPGRLLSMGLQSRTRLSDRAQQHSEWTHSHVHKAQDLAEETDIHPHIINVKLQV